MGGGRGQHGTGASVESLHPPHPSLTQGEGGSSPRGGLSFVLTTALPCSLRETWTLQLPAWGSHGIFLPIL